MTNKTIIIMGNGPSLKDINFDLLRNNDTYGLNAAYRAYDKINFYPTYFGCFDKLVVKSHKNNYQSLINSKKIKKCFFIGPEKFMTTYQTKDIYQYINLNNVYNPKLCNNKLYQNFSKNFDNFWIYNCSGTTACHTAITMGYTKIILVGMDCSYINFIPECELINKQSKFDLVIKETPKSNPNYWFDDYQIKGDKYHIPNSDIYHKPAWNHLALTAKKFNIDIVNCSTKTSLEYFRKSKLEDEL